MSAWKIAEGSTRPAFTCRLPNSSGNKLEVSGGSITAINFKMHKPGENIYAVEGSMVVIDDTTVSYLWTAGDLDEPGHYLATVEVVYDDTTTEVYPIGSYQDIYVMPLPG